MTRLYQAHLQSATQDSQAEVCDQKCFWTFLNTFITVPNPMTCIQRSVVQNVFSRHQNFNTVLHIPSKHTNSFFRSGQAPITNSECCPSAGQWGRLLVKHYKQGRRLASLFHLASLNKSLSWLVALTSSPKDILNTAFQPPKSFGEQIDDVRSLLIYELG